MPTDGTRTDLDAQAPLLCREMHGASVSVGRQEDLAGEPAALSPSRREPGQVFPKCLPAQTPWEKDTAFPHTSGHR